AVEGRRRSAGERVRSTVARGRVAVRACDARAGVHRGPRESRTRAPASPLDAPVPSEAELLALARACGEVADRAAEADRLDRAFRANAVAAMLAQRGRDAALARTFADRARAAHAALVAATAP